MQPIILASASPQRKELIKELVGNNFKIIKSNHIEKHQKNISPNDLVKYHSSKKAHKVASKLKKGIVIAADTMVFCNGKMLGKPKNRKDAKSMLLLQSNKIVKVITAITLIDVKNKKEITDTETTKVKIAKITEKQIKEYLDSNEGFDKAGGFAVQGKGSFFIQKIEGDYFNVVGLPLYKLSQMLQKLGITIKEYKQKR